MEKYSSRSVEELAETLNVMSQERKSTGLSAEMRELVCMLKAHKLRHTADAHVFCNCGGLQVLLDLLTFCEVNRDMVMILGTIGNACALNSNCRSMVKQKIVIKKLMFKNLIIIAGNEQI